MQFSAICAKYLNNYTLLHNFQHMLLIKIAATTTNTGNSMPKQKTTFVE